MPLSKKIRVLVVDDSATVRQTMTEILQSDPRIEVTGAASDPHAAVERIKACMPDVITPDIEMPRMDGLTGGSSEAALAALEKGAIEIIAKPISTPSGAARIAAECRPILAVCACHHCRDLRTLPGLLKAPNPEYRIFLRRYAEECWEPVYYAIPPAPMGRLTPPRQSPEAEL